ncbi:hypothetical protein NM688_g5707 [Phlebia brevispora]|uniref:Uncharacterized protein n=1 Tax=Phlebia brevispora TaxID=194682 RepID=A0ACC1SR48_9APHY|nr:hypothetical protein NM688_g5707 [Phlebia brevispora]
MTQRFLTLPTEACYWFGINLQIIQGAFDCVAPAIWARRSPGACTTRIAAALSAPRKRGHPGAQRWPRLLVSREQNVCRSAFVNNFPHTLPQTGALSFHPISWALFSRADLQGDSRADADPCLQLRLSAMEDSNDPTSPVSPLAPYPPLPPTEVRSRAPEFYGFVAWTSTYLLFCLYLLWALLPDEYIIWLGITWYPNREWALLIPAYTVVLVLFTYFTYFALAIASTPSFSDISTVTGGPFFAGFPYSASSRQLGYATDSKAHLPDADEPNPYIAHARPDAIPVMYDMPIGLVNRVLYGGSTRKPAADVKVT